MTPDLLLAIGILFIGFTIAASLAACCIEAAIHQFINENYFMFALELILGIEFVLLIVLFSIKLIF